MSNNEPYIKPLSRNNKNANLRSPVTDSAIVDVRTQSEWDSGHIEGATLVENLATFGSSSHQGGSPLDLAGCESCSIVVYCRKKKKKSCVLMYKERIALIHLSLSFCLCFSVFVCPRFFCIAQKLLKGSGARASDAIQVLIANGFTGKLFNGQGTSQWTGAGYDLVQSPSVVPPCTDSSGNCYMPSEVPSEMPSEAPSEVPSEWPSSTPTDTPSSSPQPSSLSEEAEDESSSATIVNPIALALIASLVGIVAQF